MASFGQILIACGEAFTAAISDTHTGLGSIKIKNEYFYLLISYPSI
jgi:hypothetical protein